MIWSIQHKIARLLGKNPTNEVYLYLYSFYFKDIIQREKKTMTHRMIFPKIELEKNYTVEKITT